MRKGAAHKHKMSIKIGTLIQLTVGIAGQITEAKQVYRGDEGHHKNKPL
jgi:hypothetical protein